MRSHRLPVAPPRIRDRPMVVVLNEWLCFHNNMETTINAMTEKLTSAPIFHWAVDSANRPNAAPVFSTWVRRKQPGITVTLLCKGILLATDHLARRSSSSTAAAMKKKYFRMDRLGCISYFLDAISPRKGASETLGYS